VDLRAVRAALESGMAPPMRRPLFGGKSGRTLALAGLGVAVVGLILGVAMSARRRPPEPPSPAAISSLVALPSRVHSNETDQFLADAIPDTLSAHLSQIQGLEVKLPPTSTDIERIGSDMARLVDVYHVSAFVLSSAFAGIGGGLFAMLQGAVYDAVNAIDRSHRCEGSADRQSASERAALLTPVAKAFAADVAVEVASLGIQVHGGMGFIEETGAAQHLRDARILPIYEGTNGIQAIDLVTRKLPLSGGETACRQIEEMRQIARRLADADCASLQATAPQIARAVDSLERATRFMLRALAEDAIEEALAGASPYLRLFATAQGSALVGATALAAQRSMAAGDNDPAQAGRVQLARFFADNIATTAPGLADVVVGGAASLKDAQLMLVD